jgi:hypothetical protein
MSHPLFPSLPGLEYPVKRSPLASSLRQKAISGREAFQPLWSTPLYRYEVSFALLRQAQLVAEWQQLQAFWNGVMFTPGGVFQYDDPNDDAADAQPFGLGDGTTTSFQLTRALGGFAEPVLNPTAGGLQVFVNGSLASFVLGAGGIVTLTPAPGVGALLTWTGGYTWLCRFDDDSLEFSNFMHLFWELKKCGFTTIRP